MYALQFSLSFEITSRYLTDVNCVSVTLKREGALRPFNLFLLVKRTRSTLLGLTVNSFSVHQYRMFCISSLVVAGTYPDMSTIRSIA